MIDTSSLSPAPAAAQSPHDAAMGPERRHDLLRTVEGRLVVLRVRSILGAERRHPSGGASRFAVLEDGTGRLYLDVFLARSDLGAPDLAETTPVNDLGAAMTAIEALAQAPVSVGGKPARPDGAVATLAAYGDRARREVYRRDFETFVGETLAVWAEAASAA